MTRRYCPTCDRWIWSTQASPKPRLGGSSCPHCGANTLPAVGERRWPSVVCGELLSAEKHWEVLRSLAADYANHSLRPIVVVDGQVEPTPIELPDNLRAALQDAAERVAKLRHEYALLPPDDRNQAAVALGSRTSEKKTAAARLNAKKGGWPKGRPRKPQT